MWEGEAEGEEVGMLEGLVKGLGEGGDEGSNVGAGDGHLGKEPINAMPMGALKPLSVCPQPDRDPSAFPTQCRRKKYLCRRSRRRGPSSSSSRRRGWAPLISNLLVKVCSRAGSGDCNEIDHSRRDDRVP